MNGKAVRAERRRVLRRLKAVWRRRYMRFGITDPGILNVGAGVRAGHPAHQCGLCSRRPPQCPAPRRRDEAAIEMAEEHDSRVLPSLGLRKRAAVTRRDGHRRFD